MTSSSIRVRIAPSPTGKAHIATAWLALFNWLFARKYNGIFIVRIEDSDRERSTKEFEVDILESLKWLEFESDEEIMRESERGHIYKKYLQQLLGSGRAFYCSHTKEELKEESEQQRATKEPPRHICTERNEKNTSGIIRFKNDEKDIIIVQDIIRGEIKFDPQLLGDFSIARNLDSALFNFAVVVDDYEMRISHVIRGEDHISNTPKQILLLRSLGFTEPAWAHMPILLGIDRSKLSKRHGALGISEYRSRGYLKEALINFIALLGWHLEAGDRGEHERELFSREELVGLFTLERVQKGGSIVNLEKLNWFNREYIKTLPLKEIVSRGEAFISKETRDSFSRDVFEKLIDTLRTRITTLKDLESEIKLIISPPNYTNELLLWNGKIKETEAKEIIDNIITLFSSIDSSEFSSKTTQLALGPLIEKNSKGSVLWPLRAALSGASASIGPFDLIDILGKETCLLRLKTAQKLLV